MPKPIDTPEDIEIPQDDASMLDFDSGEFNTMLETFHRLGAYIAIWLRGVTSEALHDIVDRARLATTDPKRCSLDARRSLKAVADIAAHEIERRKDA